MKIIILALIVCMPVLVLSQNVGIGTSTPNASAQLEISSNSKGLLIPRMTASERGLISNPAHGLLVYQTDGTVGLYVNRSQVPSTPNWSIVTEGTNFWTSSIVTPSNVYNINAGYIGIGTSAPLAKLNVSQTGYGFLHSDVANGVQIGTYIDASGGWLGTKSKDNLHFFTNNSSPLMTIDTFSNVGIGTTTPTYKLTVKADNIGISQESADGTTKVGFFAGSAGAYVQTHSNHPLNFTTGNGSAQMTLTTAGNLGIGTTTSTSRLTVNSGSNITGIEVNQSGTGLGGYFYSSGGNALYAFNSSATQPAAFFQGTNALTAIGKVGIGTSAPAQNLDLKNGRMRFTGQVSAGVASGIEFTNNAGTAVRSFVGVYDDNTLGFYGFAGAGWSFLYDAVDGTLRIGTTQKATGYLVNVGGKIIAEEVRVQLRASWPDYVFKNDYKLMPLNEVEEFIKKNNHLPGFTKAAIVEKEGTDLGETERKLLEKVEELTLYIIALEKKVNALQKDNK